MANVFKIFWQAIELYFSNFPKFLKYMSFPVLGQIFGWIWIFGISYAYIQFLPNMIKNNLMNNFSVIFLILLIITLPGLFIMLKAFWDYLITYGAVNSMLDGLVKSGTVYDFPAHNEVVTRKTPKFIGLWLCISILSLFSLFPLFWIPAGIIFIYFILVFQIFIFEPDESIFGCFRRSFQIIKGKFAQTFVLVLLVAGFTMWLLPAILVKMLTVSNLLHYLSIPFDAITNMLPLYEINSKIAFRITSLMLAQMLVIMFMNFIITGFTLPLRTICWGLWYKKNTKAKSTLDKRILKRAEE